MSVCLLITTHERSDLLAHSLGRLATLTLPDELLVIDDGGRDDCLSVVERFRSTVARRCSVRYLYLDNPGVTICSRARNHGLAHTDAELVLTSEPEAMFLTDAVAQLLDARRGAPGRVISAGTVHHARARDERDPAGCERIEGWVAPFCALYERRWLHAIGGWDEGFEHWGWEDTDLLTRLRLTGHGQLIDTSIEVLHQWHPSNACDQRPNETRFRSKSFHRGDPADLIANR